MRTVHLFSMLAAAAAMSCGGPMPTPPEQPAAPTGEVPSAAPAAEPDKPAAPTAWSDDLSKEQKGAFMKSHVEPKMAEVFQSMSADRYASFGCATCHGTAWKDHPRDALPKLTMKDGKFDVPPEMGPVVDFMMKKVVPEMATLFGKAPFDPATNQGFGCAGCHVVDM